MKYINVAKFVCPKFHRASFNPCFSKQKDVLRNKFGEFPLLFCTMQFYRQILQNKLLLWSTTSDILFHLLYTVLFYILTYVNISECFQALQRTHHWLTQWGPSGDLLRGSGAGLFLNKGALVQLFRNFLRSRPTLFAGIGSKCFATVKRSNLPILFL